MRNGSRIEHTLTMVAFVVAGLSAVYVAAAVTGGDRTPAALLLGLLVAIGIFINAFGIIILALLLPWHTLRGYLLDRSTPSRSIHSCAAPRAASDCT